MRHRDRPDPDVQVLLAQEGLASDKGLLQGVLVFGVRIAGGPVRHLQARAIARSHLHRFRGEGTAHPGFHQVAGLLRVRQAAAVEGPTFQLGRPREHRQHQRPQLLLALRGDDQTPATVEPGSELPHQIAVDGPQAAVHPLRQIPLALTAKQGVQLGELGLEIGPPAVDILELLLAGAFFAAVVRVAAEPSHGSCSWAKHRAPYGGRSRTTSDGSRGEANPCYATVTRFSFKVWPGYQIGPVVVRA